MHFMIDNDFFERVWAMRLEIFCSWRNLQGLHPSGLLAIVGGIPAVYDGLKG
ncbi:MAG: hypothetical protein HY393_01745 [Candidatus Diapherotrites archaeon]|nr:hypothetical protein [Candidatus Diapherotrites archaeon]